MIYGIGTDIVSIPRFERMLKRHGERLAARVLGSDELSAYRSCAQPAAFLAKRFAAKEAFSKALGTGFRAPLTLTRISVEHDRAGKPALLLHAKIGALMTARGVKTCHLSISDEKEFACAFVVLEA